MLFVVIKAAAVAKPAYSYFKQKFEVELKPIVEVFEYARFFDPAKVNELKPSSSDIDHLKVFPFLKDRLDALKGELPLYMAKADGVSQESGGKTISLNCLTGQEHAKLIQPSS